MSMSIATWLRLLEQGPIATEKIWFFESQQSVMVVMGDCSAWWLEFEKGTATQLVKPSVWLQ